MLPSSRPGSARGEAPEPWLLAQAAAVAAAEAIAATAAADVAAEAADTAQAAVDAASAAAAKAAIKAGQVAAQAVLAAAAAAAAMPSPDPKESSIDAGPGDTAAAAAKVASSVAAVAAAAATAAVEAATLIREQLARDIAVTALGVAHAAADGVVTAPLDPKVTPGSVVERELRHGIDAGQLRLHYQPIINVASGRPVGVEALVRWHHPERGLLAPAAFIQLAEETGLVLPLGAWVMHEACRTAMALRSRGSTPFTVAVNLSGRQLSDRGVVGDVRAALDAYGCGAERLVFEVTETCLVTDMEAACESLRELQELGASVSIDDFGTGYAPLLYLKHLAANELKIDRSFVSGLGVDSYDTAMVASLLLLAHNLDVRCVAEGVETMEQFTILKELGCDFAQGHLFSPPLDAAALDIWLDRHLAEGAGTAGAAATASWTPESLSTTARISAMHQSGASVNTIAASLNSEGSRTPSGRRWGAHSVTRALWHSTGDGKGE